MPYPLRLELEDYLEKLLKLDGLPDRMRSLAQEALESVHSWGDSTLREALQDLAIEFPNPKVQEFLEGVEFQEMRIVLAFQEIIGELRDLYPLERAQEAAESFDFPQTLAAELANLLADEWSYLLLDSAAETARDLKKLLARGFTTPPPPETGAALTVLALRLDRAAPIIADNRQRITSLFAHGQIRATTAALNGGFGYGGPDDYRPGNRGRALRNSFGLTSRQVSANGRYRRTLALAEDDEGRARYTRSEIGRMTEAHRRGQLRSRAALIARTEATRAASEGERALISQAIDDGLLDPGQVVRTWITSQDERVRSWHASKHGVKRGQDEPFPGGVLYPGDPNASAAETVNCRCRLRIDVVNAGVLDEDAGV